VGLFARDVTVCVVSSGSGGNCTYVGDAHAGVLIDCGLATKQVMARLAEAGLADAPIDGVLVTHEHSDHVGAAGVLSRALARRGKPVPFWMTAGTHEALDPRVVPDGIELVKAGSTVAVKHLKAECFPVPHDTKDPVAWRVHLGSVTVGVVTDLGRSTKLVVDKLRGCDIAVLEFNHDEELLMSGPYPYWLKQRIKGNHGHLSNGQAQGLLADALASGPGSSRLKTLILGHLSEENNRPEIALAACRATLRAAGVRDEIAVHLGLQHAAVAPIRARTELW
jgi:phosphoribosyl 1,2-cyclic phosphodiesterase